MKLNVLRADPAGNITLFVLDPIERERRAALAAKLMRRLPDMKIDQVGFACPADADTDGRMEMMGGEFCGNATRAYAMYVARQRGGLSEVRLRVSGFEHIVTAAVDLARGAARAEMPLPRAVRAAEVEGHAGTLVDLAGIAHLVIEGVAPSEDFFRAAEPLFSTEDCIFVLTVCSCCVAFQSISFHNNFFVLSFCHWQYLLFSAGVKEHFVLFLSLLSSCFS